MINHASSIRSVSRGSAFDENPSFFRATKCIEPHAIGRDKAKSGQCLDGRHSHRLRDVEISLSRTPKAEVIFTSQLRVSAQPGIAIPSISVKRKPTAKRFNRVRYFNILDSRATPSRFFCHSHTERGKQQLSAVPDAT